MDFQTWPPNEGNVTSRNISEMFHVIKCNLLPEIKLIADHQCVQTYVNIISIAIIIISWSNIFFFQYLHEDLVWKP